MYIKHDAPHNGALAHAGAAPDEQVAARPPAVADVHQQLADLRRAAGPGRAQASQQRLLFCWR
jgi:hypothetical protein